MEKVNFKIYSLNYPKFSNYSTGISLDFIILFEVLLFKYLENGKKPFVLDKNEIFHQFGVFPSRIDELLDHFCYEGYLTIITQTSKFMDSITTKILIEFNVDEIESTLDEIMKDKTDFLNFIKPLLD